MSLLAPLSGTLSPLGVTARGPRGVQSEFCLGFDGVDDYVSIPYASWQDWSTASEFSIAIWVKLASVIPSSGVGQRMIFTRRGVGGGGDTDQTKGWGLFAIHYDDGSANYRGHMIEFAFWLGKECNCDFQFDLNWHHVVFTQSGATQKIYVDGLERPVTQFGSGSSIPSSATVPRFGGWQFNSSEDFGGLLDDPRIYSRALTADEISAIYNNVTAAPTSGLVAHFPLDEGTGTTTTDSVGGLVGTLTGGPTWQPQVPPRLIRNRETEDWSVSFDGTDDYIHVSGTSPMHNLTDYTLSMWVRRSKTGNTSLFEVGSYLSSGLLFRLEEAGVGTFSIYYGSTQHAFTYTLTNTWTLLTVTRSGTTTRAYVNGFLIGTASTTSNAISDGSALGTRIGQVLSGAASNGNYGGLIKDVRIYNITLPAASIRKLSRGVEPTETPVARWRLNDGTGLTANDSIGSNHGTLTNGPTWSGDVPQWMRQAIVSTQAATFDGVDDFIRVTDGYTNTIQNDQTFTISLWVNADDVTASPALFDADSAPSLHFVSQIWDSGLNWGCGNGLVRTYVTSFSSGVWYHILLSKTASGDNGNVYVNGVLLTSYSGTLGTLSNFSSDFLIGTYRGLFSPLAGRIDEFLVHNRPLSIAEALDAAAGYLVTAGLVSRYKLDGNAQDSVGLNHGTEQGGVAYSSSVPGTL